MERVVIATPQVNVRGTLRQARVLHLAEGRCGIWHICWSRPRRKLYFCDPNVWFSVFGTSKMRWATYYVVLAYFLLATSVATFLIALLITGLILVDIFFHAGFGYPKWSILFGILGPCLGYLMFRLTLDFLRRIRQRQRELR